MTSQAISFAKEAGTGKVIRTTIQDIISSRVLWEGDSGSGKSHGMTRMIEETDGLAQRIVIDLEGEYFPLKDNYTFLLVAKTTETVKPNVELNVDDDIYIEKLVRKMLEKSIDSIIDLSEVPGDATHFLNEFQKAVFKYAKLMKRPLLIFVDEAHVFAPEKGQGTEESLKAMKELAKRGRKRGIGLICGTQAIADFSKDVVRQLRLRFIGNCTYDHDVKAAAHFLGFAKDRESELRDLGEEHHFFVGGKGITVGGKKPKEVIKIQVGPNKTKLFDFDFKKNIKFKEKDSQEIKNVAASFDDIPQVIEEELSEKEKLQRENFEVKKQLQDQKVKLIRLEQARPQADPKQLEKTYSDGYSKGLKHAEAQYRTTVKKLEDYIKGIKNNAASIKQIISGFESATAKQFQSILETMPDLPNIDNKPVFTTPAVTPPKQTPKQHVDSIIAEYNSDVKLSGPETKVLTAILQQPGQRGTKKRIALYCGYAVKGGAYGNITGKLRSNGFITYEGDELVATDQGIAAIPTVEPLPTDPQSVISFWTNKLGQAKGKVLAAIFEQSPISREELAERTGYAAGGGAFGNILGNLRTLGLIDYLPNKEVGLSKELSPVYA